MVAGKGDVRGGSRVGDRTHNRDLAISVCHAWPASMARDTGRSTRLPAHRFSKFWKLLLRLREHERNFHRFIATAYPTAQAN